MLLQRLDLLGLGLAFLVTPGTTVLVMALRTLEAEPVNVLLVPEDDLRTRHVLVLGLVDLDVRLGYRRMHLAHNVILGRDHGRTAP